MKNKSLISDKLKAYSALAASAAIANSANAQIIYTDVNPDVTKSAHGDAYMLDLNNDATVDFILHNYIVSSSGLTLTSIYAEIQNQNAIAGPVTSSYPLPFALNNGDMISASTTPWNDTTINNGFDYLTLMVSPPYNIAMGNWQNTTDKYLPLRIKISGQDHYGWVRLSSTATTTTSVFTVKDYAYNSVANSGITAGQMPAGINENNLSAAKIYAYNNNITVDLGNEIKAEGNIIVTNILGEQVYYQNISNSKTQFILNAASGVYLVTINNEGNTITKKVYIQ